MTFEAIDTSRCSRKHLTLDGSSGARTGECFVVCVCSDTFVYFMSIYLLCVFAPAFESSLPVNQTAAALYE